MFDKIYKWFDTPPVMRLVRFISPHPPEQLVRPAKKKEINAHHRKRIMAEYEKQVSEYENQVEKIISRSKRKSGR